MDRLAIAIVQIDHGNPARATAAHRANASNVAVAALMIFVVDAPVRGSPSSHATMRVHLGSVHSSSPAKNAAPLPFVEAESPVQQRAEDLSSETRAFEHVKTAGKILDA